MKPHQQAHYVQLIFGIYLLIITQSALAKQELNINAEGVLLHGYDPVAYFVQKKPMLGWSTYQANYRNGIFYFISAENLTLFLENPDHYAPAYGGFCSYGVRMGKKFDIDPHSWTIVDGVLYLQLNQATQLVWKQNIQSNISIGNQVWSEIRTMSISKL